MVGGEMMSRGGNGSRHLMALSFLLSHKWLSSLWSNLRTESVTSYVLVQKMK